MADELIKLSTVSDVSDSEVSSLCSSELELEMTWGEGPIAPLRAEDDGAAKKNVIPCLERSGSNGNGSSRARTPQKCSSGSISSRSKRLVNVHPMRSAGYLSKPDELPLSVRKQQRWFNDHHFGNRAASTRLEDLMEHMEINVEWRSNFQKLAEPQNESLQSSFRKGGGVSDPPAVPRNHRKDKWNGAEKMFARVDRRARTLMLRSFNSFASFIEAVECVVLHFIQWREVPSELEVARPLLRMLKHPIEVTNDVGTSVRLILPLLDSAFHRLIIHSVCQFYGVRSRTECDRHIQTKIMVLKSPKDKHLDIDLISLCDFIVETRVARHVLYDHALELQSKSSECSEDFLIVEAPQV
ncbi:hypothetical protein CCR75_005838 [Bremia lactucae]|uniref:R3H domain-containing protein n=1 Tax=Bremia lactucae TaxID=4779 RepID=A0A976FKH0_BRELC|nr:hypothetical protein CCR75_005838 [Bremia lactucae]